MKPAFAALLALILAAPAAPAVEKPAQNVVLISIDTLRADRLGCYGYGKGASPNIDAIASEGTLYTHAFTPVPLTLPAHTSLLTGLLPTRTGVRDNGFFRAPDSLVLLPEILKQRGLATGAFLSGLPLNRRFGLNQGFDIFDDRIRENDPRAHLYPERTAEETVSHALEWATSAKGPYFLFIHLFEPHAPYRASPDHPTLAPYDAEIAVADDAVGRITAFLKQRNQLATSLLIVTSDHGESLGEHGERSHGVFLYDATLQIPLIIRGPGFDAGMRDGRLVSLVDILPTVLDALGIAKPAGIDGASMLSAPVRQVAYAESFYPRFDLGWSELRAARTLAEKLVMAPVMELYDLSSDPREVKNLYDATHPMLPLLQSSLNELIKLDAGATPTHPDSDTTEALRSLGYVQAGRPAGDRPLPDPKTRIRLLDTIDGAVELIGAGDDRAAASLLRTAIEANPDTPELLVIYADLLERTAGPLDILKFLDSAGDTAHPRLKIIRARALTDTQRFDQARSTLNEALAAGGDAAVIANEVGVAHAFQDNLQEALAQFEKALSIDPNFRDAWTNAGHIWNQTGDHAKASDAYTKALSLGEPTASLLNGAAIAALKAGKLEESERQARAALELRPDGADLEINLARILAARGRRQEALDRLDAVLKRTDLPQPVLEAAKQTRLEIASAGE